MSDLKKLFRRDRFYWVITAVIMTLLVIYMLANVNVDGLHYKLFHLEDNLEESLQLPQYLQEFWDIHPELRNPGGVGLAQIPYLFLESMVSVTVIAALIAQAVRLMVQETQNRAEVLRTFPVKSSNTVTCHYLSGLLTVSIPLLLQIVIIRLDILYVEKNTDFIYFNKEQLWAYAWKAMIIFMLHYSLLILCRKVTNHVPGTVFTFAVAELVMQQLAGYCLGMYWNNLAEDSISNWVFWVIVTVVFILFSYIADQKKDCARNGVYAFPIVHWVMLAAVFIEIYLMFYGVFDNTPKVVSVLVTVAASMLMTAGVHFVTKPKMI